MQDYGLYRNSEGYSDPTVAEAIKGMAKPGEIWKYKGREVLIVKNQGVYCNILTLVRKESKAPTTIEVAGRYTTPGKLSYAFNSDFGAFVERITKDEYDFVLKEVYIALAFFSKSEPVAEQTEECKIEAIAESAVNKDCEHENEVLKKKNALLRSMYDDLLDKFIEKFGSV